MLWLILPAALAGTDPCLSETTPHDRLDCMQRQPIPTDAAQRQQVEETYRRSRQNAWADRVAAVDGRLPLAVSLPPEGGLLRFERHGLLDAPPMGPGNSLTPAQLAERGVEHAETWSLLPRTGPPVTVAVEYVVHYQNDCDASQSVFAQVELPEDVAAGIVAAVPGPSPSFWTDTAPQVDREVAEARVRRALQVGESLSVSLREDGTGWRVYASWMLNDALQSAVLWVGEGEMTWLQPPISGHIPVPWALRDLDGDGVSEEIRQWNGDTLGRSVVVDGIEHQAEWWWCGC